MVNHHMDAAETVQVEVRGKLVRDNSCPKLDELIGVPDQPPRFLLFCWVLEMLVLVQCLFRTCHKPMYLDCSTRSCTYICGQT